MTAKVEKLFFSILDSILLLLGNSVNMRQCPDHEQSVGEVKPVIDRNYKLSEVPEAIRYLEEGHAQGKVVITV